MSERDPSDEPASSTLQKQLSSLVSGLAGLESDLEHASARSRLFETTFRRAGVALLLVDPAAERIVDANERASEMLEYPPGELVGLELARVHPHEMSALRAFSETVLEEGSGWTSNLSCTTLSGSVLPAELVARCFKLDGQVLLVVCVRTRAELRQRDVESMVDQQRALVGINRAMLRHRQRAPLFDAIAGAMRPLIAADSLLVMLREEGQLVVYAHTGSGGDRVGTRYPCEGSLLGAMLETRRPFRARESDLDDYPVTRAALKEAGHAAVCGLPLVAAGEVLGAIVFEAVDAERFEHLDLDFLMEAADAVAVALDNSRAYEELQRLKERLASENTYLQEEIRSEHDFTEIVGQSSALAEVQRRVQQVATTTAPVLITGETGTGKELVARAVHAFSERRDRPLVKVNCGAISAGLVESELFGHEKGAFTGAVSRRIGRFELADGGTIFLDELGELPVDTQVKLLRVLQEGELERVGSSTSLAVDVRVIAATNKDLGRAVSEGTFREDLLFRLNVFPIAVPPLRERRDDIPLLVSYFASKLGREQGKRVERVEQSSIERLLAYGWPGNVRELQNVVERALILSTGPVLRIDEALEGGARTAVSGGATAPHAHPPSPARFRGTLEQLERSYIEQVLLERDWVLEGDRGAAAHLGLHPNTLRSRLKKLGLKRPR